jgi:isopentenyl diphosphate isomerase/L-lactate dehydrogenase-like FMN-dependent dehydrogenase
MSKALDYQRQIYLNGLSGIKPEFPFTWDELERRTRNSVPERAATYIFGGAGSGQTMRNNRTGLDAETIVPSMLTGVEAIDLSIGVLGTKLKHPVIAAPVGVLEMAHPEGDLALAEACRETGTLMVISSQASFPMEEICKTLGNTPRWFQLYWNRTETVTKSFVQRAEACGCSALVVTVDTVIPGWRTADLAGGYLPFLEGKGIAQYVSDPVFTTLAERTAVERQPGQKITPSLIASVFRMNKVIPGGFFGNLRSQRAIKLIRTFSEHFPHPFLSWQHLSLLREWTSLPIIVKGIQSREDAEKALQYGAEGVYVSNHGGRQIDGAIGSFDALKTISKSTHLTSKLLFDSGVRSGADVFKALTNGASVVGLGRPYVCGLALGGVKGAVSVFNSILSELEVTMTLAGKASLKEIRR